MFESDNIEWRIFGDLVNSVFAESKSPGDERRTELIICFLTSRIGTVDGIKNASRTSTEKSSSSGARIDEGS